MVKIGLCYQFWFRPNSSANLGLVPFWKTCTLPLKECVRLLSAELEWTLPYFSQKTSLFTLCAGCATCIRIFNGSYPVLEQLFDTSGWAWWSPMQVQTGMAESARNSGCSWIVHPESLLSRTCLLCKILNLILREHSNATVQLFRSFQSAQRIHFCPFLSLFCGKTSVWCWKQCLRDQMNQEIGKCDACQVSRKAGQMSLDLFNPVWYERIFRLDTHWTGTSKDWESGFAKWFMHKSSSLWNCSLFLLPLSFQSLGWMSKFALTTQKQARSPADRWNVEPWMSRVWCPADWCLIEIKMCPWEVKDLGHTHWCFT